MNPETVSAALAISIATNFILVLVWSGSRSRLRRVMRADYVCLLCGVPQRPNNDANRSCPSCQRKGDRGEWLEL